jgi:cbb3-type cytochrome oxidase maturation protein
MSIIYVLIPIAILFVCIGLGIFFWAVRSKQFDDLDKEAFSILFDNENKASKQQPENPPLSDTISPDDKSPLNAKKEL